MASHDKASREAKLLVDRREALVNTRTRTINSLLWRVHELDPAHAPKPRSLDLAKHQQALHAWLLTVAQGAAGVDEVRGLVAEMALDELEDIIALTARIKRAQRAGSSWAQWEMSE